MRERENKEHRKRLTGSSPEVRKISFDIDIISRCLLPGIACRSHFQQTSAINHSESLNLGEINEDVAKFNYVDKLPGIND